LLGDIVAEQQHSGDLASIIAHRLAGEVREQLPGLLALAADQHRGLTTTDGLTVSPRRLCRVEAVKLQLRQNIAQRTADEIAIACDPLELLIGEVEPERGSGQARRPKAVSQGVRA